MEKEDYRGRCFSTHNKRTKTGDLKRSGNFSALTFREQTLQSKDYKVWLRKDKDNDPILIVGDHTPLYTVMPMAVYELALNDPFFMDISREGVVKINGKEYESRKRLTRRKVYSVFDKEHNHRFVYREEIYTYGDFTYQFPEY